MFGQLTSLLRTMLFQALLRPFSYIKRKTVKENKQENNKNKMKEKTHKHIQQGRKETWLFWAVSVRSEREWRGLKDRDGGAVAGASTAYSGRRWR